MGYTHYWYRKPSIPQAKFDAIAADFNKILLALDDMGVRLADGCGENTPIVTSDEIVFNGYSNCGHAKNENISIPWPTQSAQGVGSNRIAEAGTWFAGTLLDTRACDGDCSYETFAFERVWQVPDYQLKDADYKDGLYFVFCKTAYRPYDVAVTAFLIIAKQHLGKAIRVTSDGEDCHWNDAKRLCYIHLGYGPEFVLGESLERKDAA